MARGTPVLAARATALPETGGDAAAYFDPSDPEDLRRQLRSLLDDRPLREAMAAAGREWVGGFSWERTAARRLPSTGSCSEGRGGCCGLENGGHEERVVRVALVAGRRADLRLAHANAHHVAPWAPRWELALVETANLHLNPDGEMRWKLTIVTTANAHHVMGQSVVDGCLPVQRTPRPPLVSHRRHNRHSAATTWCQSSPKPPPAGPPGLRLPEVRPRGGRAGNERLTRHSSLVKQAGRESMEDQAWSSRSSSTRSAGASGQRSRSYRGASRPARRWRSSATALAEAVGLYLWDLPARLQGRPTGTGETRITVTPAPGGPAACG